MTRHLLSVSTILALTALSAGPVLAKEADGAVKAPPRRGTVGAQFSPGADGRLVYQGARAGSPAAASTLTKGDVLVSLNGNAINGQTAMQKNFWSLVAGQPATFTVEREGANVDVKVTPEPKPMEKSEDFDVIYGAVATGDAVLRTIVTKPKGEGPFPVVYYVQGYTCFSVELTHPALSGIRDFLYGLTKRGYVVYRIEKFGMGDSTGPNCFDIGFDKELEGFRAGLEDLRGLDYIDPSRVYVFGHSMGGIQGPMLSSPEKVAGLIVYGTGVKPWFEYMIENSRRQIALSGAPLVEQDAAMRDIARFNAALLLEQRPLPEVLRQQPDLVRENNGIENESMIMGRHYTFWAELAKNETAKHFAQAGVPVLALHGASDFVTSREEHELIAAIANESKAGSGTFKEVPASDHTFYRAADNAEAFALMNQGGAAKREFNPAILDIVDAWLRGQQKGA